MSTPFQGANIATDPYSAVVLAKGPVGYWRLDEAGGPTAVDASGNGANGAYHGNPTFGDPGAISGSAGLCRQVEIDTPEREKAFQPGNGFFHNMYVYPITRNLENEQVLLGEIVFQHQCCVLNFRRQGGDDTIRPLWT